MLLTVSNLHASVEGKPIQQYIGIVTAEAIIGANIFKDLFAGIRDIVGGRSGTYERVIEEARQNALVELQQKAQQLGANAVVVKDLVKKNGVYAGIPAKFIGTRRKNS